MSLGPLKKQYLAVLKSKDGSDLKRESRQKSKSDLSKKMAKFKYLLYCKGGHATIDLRMFKNIIAFLIFFHF